jgi:hypothetical protein
MDDTVGDLSAIQPGLTIRGLQKMAVFDGPKNLEG